MKITKQYLKQVIKEEIQRLTEEDEFDMYKQFNIQDQELLPLIRTLHLLLYKAMLPYEELKQIADKFPEKHKTDAESIGSEQVNNVVDVIIKKYVQSPNTAFNPNDPANKDRMTPDEIKKSLEMYKTAAKELEVSGRVKEPAVNRMYRDFPRLIKGINRPPLMRT